MQRLGVKTRLKNTLGELIILNVTPGEREEDTGWQVYCSHTAINTTGIISM